MNVRAVNAYCIGRSPLLTEKFSYFFSLVLTAADDGVSGVGFDRPGLNRMKDDIEAGKINLVICKDEYSCVRQKIVFQKIGYQKMHRGA